MKDPNPELKPEDVSDAGLEIMKSHLQKAYDRLGKAADRSDGLDLNDMTDDPQAPSFKMTNAAASIDQTIIEIDRELQRRQEEEDQ